MLRERETVAYEGASHYIEAINGLIFRFRRSMLSVLIGLRTGEEDLERLLSNFSGFSTSVSFEWTVDRFRESVIE